MPKKTKPNTKDKRSSGIQVIDRATKILNTLGAQPNGMSLGQIAQQVNLPRSTVQRIIAALETSGFVRSEGAGGIGLGAGLLRLISSAHADLITIAQPWLKELSNATQETVVLSRPSNLQLMVEHRILADRELQVIPRLGLINMPLYKSSAGKALLALNTDTQVSTLLLSQADSFTEHPVPKLNEILLQLKEIRKNGIAFDRNDIMEGFSTMAIALDSILGRFSVSLPIPTIRFEKHQAYYHEKLLECKMGLIKEIGIINCTLN